METLSWNPAMPAVKTNNTAAQQQVPGEMRRAKREDIRIHAYTRFRLRLESHDEKGKMHRFFRQIENLLLQTTLNGGSCTVHS